MYLQRRPKIRLLKCECAQDMTLPFIYWMGIWRDFSQCLLRLQLEKPTQQQQQRQWSESNNRDKIFHACFVRLFHVPRIVFFFSFCFFLFFFLLRFVVQFLKVLVQHSVPYAFARIIFLFIHSMCAFRRNVFFNAPHCWSPGSL